MANLIIDIGNAAVKVAWAEGATLGKCFRYQGIRVMDFLMDIISRQRPKVIAVSSSRSLDHNFRSALAAQCDTLVIVDECGNLPCGVGKYVGKIGSDRLAAAVAAARLFEGKDCIVFDFGSMLNIDFVDSNGQYAGGNVSLGLRSRYKAVSRYAQNLPSLSGTGSYLPIGQDTEQSIESGVNLGIIFEVKGYLQRYPDNTVIFTGGDADYFAKRIESPVFIVYNLVLMGLALIASHFEGQ